MELLEALKTIRKECKNHDKCAVCPMHDKDRPDQCGITYGVVNPSEWGLEGDKGTMRSLFRR